MNLETLSIAVAGGVAAIELNRPDNANAINQQMWLDIRSAFHGMDEMAEVRVVVISGRGAYAKGATGNVATGDVVYLPQGLGPDWRRQRWQSAIRDARRAALTPFGVGVLRQDRLPVGRDRAQFGQQLGFVSPDLGAQLISWPCPSCST